MKRNPKATGRASSMAGGLASGAGVSLATTLLLAAILAWLTDGEIIAESSVGYGVMVLLLAASFLGAMIAGTRIKRRRMMVCLLSGMIYFGTLLSITALFFGGQYSAVLETLLLVLCGSVLAAFVGLREKRGGNRRKIPAVSR